MNSANLRIGNGFDAHKFSSGRNLVIGGVKIPYHKGLIGHSDADVLVHAIMDAILGAIALGDIGKFFPDNNPKYKDADSLKMLSSIINMKEFNDWEISNIDSIIIAEEPKLAQYIDTMRINIAQAITTDISNVSVKATTTEKLGFCGRGEGIAASAVVLLKRKS